MRRPPDTRAPDRSARWKSRWMGAQTSDMAEVYLKDARMDQEIVRPWCAISIISMASSEPPAAKDGPSYATGQAFTKE